MTSHRKNDDSSQERQYFDDRYDYNIVDGILIVTSIIIMAIQTLDLSETTQFWLGVVDFIINIIFLCMIVLCICIDKEIHYKLLTTLNFIVTVVSFFSFVKFVGVLRFINIFRILRVLRLAKFFKDFFKFSDKEKTIYLLLGGVMYLQMGLFCIYSFMGNYLFESEFDEWFGTFFKSLFSLFQVYTLESWSSVIARTVMKTYTWAWFFFVSFILLNTYCIKPFIEGIIVNAMFEKLDTIYSSKKEEDDKEFLKNQMNEKDIVNVNSTVEDSYPFMTEKSNVFILNSEDENTQALIENLRHIQSRNSHSH